MSFEVRFPGRRDEPLAETPMMWEMANRTLAVHPGSPLVVWTGRHRLGKTTTAKWLTQKINEAFDRDDPDAFRAVHYEVGEIPQWGGHGQKKAIRSLYHQLIGPLDEGVYRTTPPEALAEQLVFGTRKKHVGMVFVDEAGLLSLDAIRGMTLVRDVAENMGHILSLVFIGMDDLPSKMRRNKQVSGRVHEWCYFVPYSVDETWDLLAALHPHFRGKDREDSDARAQVEFIHETIGGVPGEIVPFLRKVDHRQKAYGKPIDLKLLKAVHLLSIDDMNRSIEQSKRGYTDEEPGARTKNNSAPRGEDSADSGSDTQDVEETEDDRNRDEEGDR